MYEVFSKFSSSTGFSFAACYIFIGQTEFIKNSTNFQFTSTELYNTPHLYNLASKWIKVSLLNIYILVFIFIYFDFNRIINDF